MRALQSHPLALPWPWPWPAGLTLALALASYATSSGAGARVVVRERALLRFGAVAVGRLTDAVAALLDLASHPAERRGEGALGREARRGRVSTPHAGREELVYGTPHTGGRSWVGAHSNAASLMKFRTKRPRPATITVATMPKMPPSSAISVMGRADCCE